ncbi:4Fe-4S ferredoxin, partial [candidate division WOR-3 bacterium]|nr:4Fe-4S ferredoxin [candidate division WOR-3 bacterium]
MRPRVISPEQLNDLLDKLAGRTALHAPAKVKDWTEFRRVRSHREIDASRVNTKQPAKAALFPPHEVMFRYDRSGSTAEPEAQAEMVLYGVRPCDAAGLAFIGKFFAGNGPADPYVRTRREKTTVIGLACSSPADTCFCLAVGGSPSGTRGMDLLLTDLGGRYVAEPQSAKGEALVR